MKEEFFDIVDENNVPTGETKPRDVVHNEMQDWHRATHIWVMNDKREILCQQRSMNKDKNPGMWQSFFGGHLMAGEEYESNAINELQEELGLIVTHKELIPLYVKKSEKAKHFGQVFVLYWNGKVSDLKFADGEVEQVKWIALDDLKQMIEGGLFCNSLDATVVKLVEVKIK